MSFSSSQRTICAWVLEGEGRMVETGRSSTTRNRSGYPRCDAMTWQRKLVERA